MKEKTEKWKKKRNKTPWSIEFEALKEPHTKGSFKSYGGGVRDLEGYNKRWKNVPFFPIESEKKKIIKKNKTFKKSSSALL